MPIEFPLTGAQGIWRAAAPLLGSHHKAAEAASPFGQRRERGRGFYFGRPIVKRVWIAVAFALATCVLAAPAQAADPPVNFTLGVTSGDVTNHKVVTWAHTDGAAKVEVRVYDDPALTSLKKKKDGNATAANDFTVKIDVDGLKENTQYYYKFVQKNSTGNESDVGAFRTAPKKNKPADLTFTYSSDSDGTKVAGVPQEGNFDVLAAAEAENGQFFVYAGNTIYGDSSHGTPAVTQADFENKYKENRTYPNLASLLKSTSTYAQMDDHEVENDYDGQTVNPTLYANGRQAFLEYMPVREKGLLHDSSCAGDPLYRTVHWGSDVDLFILDGRSCRSADVRFTPCGDDLGPTLPTAVRTTFPFSLFLTPSPPPGCLAAINDPSRTVLGPVQKKRFKKDLLKSNATWKFILPDYPMQQFFVRPYDRWEGYAAERNEILNFVRDNGIENVVSLSGDARATLQNQLFIDKFTDPGTIAEEFVTGPIGADTLQEEVLATAGPIGLFAFNQTLNLAGIDCRHLNKFTYGKVAVNSAGGTSTIDSRDSTGAVITDQNVPTTFCTRTLP